MLYYRLTNFYQNHRRYVKSVEEGQLQGQNLTAQQLQKSGACAPLTVAPNGKPYYPCGLIANSLFNGTPPRLGPSLADNRYVYTTTALECGRLWRLK
jgi:LEM3 (ligand-effect modulator 3) family / CDC50 family